MILKKSFLFLLFPVAAAAQPAIDSLLTLAENRFSAEAAYNHVKFFSQYWRVAGGSDFNSCVDHILTTLRSDGYDFFDPPATMNHPSGYCYIERDSLSDPAWNPTDASFTVVSPVDTTLHTFSATPVMLCRNSYAIDTTAELVSVGRGNSEADYSRIDVKGKIVFGSASVNSLLRHALAHGAIGVVSCMVRPYNHPEKFPDIISEEEIAYSKSQRSFGLKISAHSESYLRTLLARGNVNVHISIATTFTNGELRTLVAEIPGSRKPNERVIYVAHLDHYKPGANDNASGSGTLAEMASTLSWLISHKALPQPARTITFLWVDEYKGTNAWIESYREEAKHVLAVINLDMTGENTAVTGGQFWMERTPDPASIWLRPPDKHTEWGAPTLEAGQLLPTWLNDFYFSVLQREAARADWIIGQHPFEGGSDNEPFLHNGIPAVTNWHFTDYFYHSSMDDTDKVSPKEMKNVGTAALAAGYAIASPNEEVFQFALSSLAAGAHRRLNNESENTKALLDSVSRSQHQYFLQRQKEKEILDAWSEWYDGAFVSLKKFPILLTPGASQRIDHERAGIRALRKKIGERLGLE